MSVLEPLQGVIGFMTFVCAVIYWWKVLKK